MGLKSERLNAIERYVYSKEIVSKDELCETFQVSKGTLRRDLDELEKKGSIIKIYGGVKSNLSDLLPLPVRSSQAVEEKKRIGKLASQFVEDGDTIFIDSGSTAVQIIPNITDKKNVTIITHSLNVMLKASQYENMGLIGLGGYYSKQTQSFVGATTFQNLSNMNIAKAFMASTGVTLQNGMMNTTLFEAEIKRGIISRSQSIYLLVDSTKIGKRAVHTVCPLEKITAIVTDKCPDDEYMEFFNRNGIDVVY